MKMHRVFLVFIAITNFSMLSGCLYSDGGYNHRGHQDGGHDEGRGDRHGGHNDDHHNESRGSHGSDDRRD